jgi:hypothetical protein
MLEAGASMWPALSMPGDINAAPQQFKGGGLGATFLADLRFGKLCFCTGKLG